MTRLPGTNLRIAAAAALLLLALMPMADRIPANGGLGYDGRVYGALVPRLSVGNVFEELTGDPTPGLRIDDYLAHRIVPLVFAHEGLALLGVAITPASVIAWFSWANVLLTALASWLWARAGDELGLGAGEKWLGFTLLLVSYGCWKMPVYYPVLTDTFALALGCASLLLFLQRRNWAQAGLGLLGTFAWPSFAYFAALLVAFPRTGDTPSSPAPRRLAAVAAAAVAVGFSAFALWLVASGFTIGATPVRPLPLLLPVSVAFTGAALFFGLRSLLDSGALWRSLSPRDLLASPWPWLAAAMLALGAVGVQALASRASVAGPWAFLRDTAYTSVTQPGSAFLAHVLYYGPLLVFLPFAWRRICRSVQRQGTGLVACFALALLVGVGSESRKLINFLPFVALFLTVALTPVVTTSRQRWLLVALAVAFSKVWLPMGHDLILPFLGTVAWRTLYVSSRGPWIDETAYAIQLVPVLLLLWGFGLWWLRSPRAAASAAADPKREPA